MKEILLTDTTMTTTTFSDLGLDAALLKALTAEGYTTPTPIQAQAIPGVMAGRDLMGIAQTGTGKTAAFALPILHRLAADRRKPLRCGARVLILSPTRELATQIAQSFRTYGKHTGLTVAAMYGGMPIRPQISAMKNGVDILVATPGRLIDHMDQRTVDIAGTEILVLDEADQMLDMGFIQPIRRILSKLSQRRQTLFFSATMPREIGTLAAEILKDPLRVQVTAVAKTADRVRQSVIHVEAQKKSSLLVELFSDPSLKRAIVFTRTKRGADKVARHLETAGILVAAIHGNKSQGQRERALSEFRNGRIRGLIATDIAARGIDIDDVSHVINYELPNIPESYVHRIGRTARAGAEGTAISLCAGDERDYLRDIERTTRQTIPATHRTGDATLVATSGGGSPERSHRQHHAGHRTHANGSGAKPGPRGGGRPGQGKAAQGKPSHGQSHGKSNGAAGGQHDRRADDRGPKRDGNGSGGQQRRSAGRSHSAGNSDVGFRGLPRSGTDGR
jgi:ATP-dependent RNA helicase RhlE